MRHMTWCESGTYCIEKNTVWKVKCQRNANRQD